jgi:hypothetical protein
MIKNKIPDVKNKFSNWKKHKQTLFEFIFWFLSVMFLENSIFIVNNLLLKLSASNRTVNYASDPIGQCKIYFSD